MNAEKARELLSKLGGELRVETDWIGYRAHVTLESGVILTSKNENTEGEALISLWISTTQGYIYTQFQKTVELFDRIKELKRDL